MPNIRSATLNVALLGRASDRLGAVAGGAYLSGELRGDLNCDQDMAWPSNGLCTCRRAGAQA